MVENRRGGRSVFLGLFDPSAVRPPRRRGVGALSLAVPSRMRGQCGFDDDVQAPVRDPRMEQGGDRIIIGALWKKRRQLVLARRRKARSVAHIGAIEELEKSGFEIQRRRRYVLGCAGRRRLCLAGHGAFQKVACAISINTRVSAWWTCEHRRRRTGQGRPRDEGHESWFNVNREDAFRFTAVACRYLHSRDAKVVLERAAGCTVRPSRLISIPSVFKPRAPQQAER